MTFKNYKEGDVITEQEYISINKTINSKWSNFGVKKLEENKTVFFNKSVQLSRTEFKKQYPTNKIVHNLKDADYYITNKAPHYYISFYKNKSRILNTSEFNGRLTEVITNLNECVDFINNTNNIINSDKIKFKSEEEELPQEMKDKISSMLQSKDKDTFDLGWNILFKYDHIKCVDDFHILISKANTISFWGRKKSRIIETKLKEIKKNYPNLKY